LIARCYGLGVPMAVGPIVRPFGHGVPFPRSGTMPEKRREAGQ